MTNDNSKPAGATGRFDRPRPLTPEELEALRQDKKDTSASMKQILQRLKQERQK